MEITILGNYGPYPKAGGACSGYLITQGDKKILLDCGNGVLSRLLLQIGSIDELDAIILTHLHSDHISDVMILRYAIALNKKTGLVTRSIPLYAPSEPKEIYDSIQFMDAFIMEPIVENKSIDFGVLKISFKSMDHGIPTYGVVVENGDKRLVYSSDTRLCESLYEISRNADVLLSECNLLHKDLREDVFHLSAKQVGQVARENNVKKLFLTHLWPEYPLDKILDEVKEEFSGDVRIAEEFTTYEI